jgi:regulator of protease activity HflC (stomatin/prohibitin superfamily)
VPSQDVISRDNVSVKVNAVIYSRSRSAEGHHQVENYLVATSQLQTTLRRCWVAPARRMLAERS